MTCPHVEMFKYSQLDEVETEEILLFKPGCGARLKMLCSKNVLCHNLIWSLSPWEKETFLSET